MDNPTVLLIEDNQDDIDLTVRAFQKSRIKIELIIAHNGVEALDYLFATGLYSDRNPRDLPVVTLLDLKLPRMDGLEVLRRLRANERTQLLPVVVLTTSSEEKDIIQSYSLGANSYIRKPVEFERFMDAVNHLGIYWLLLNESPIKRI